VPVLLTAPPRRCARMTALCPAPQVRREPGIPADAGPLGRSRRLGVAPPPDAGVAAVDASLVGGRAPVPHFLMPLREMGMLGRLRWRDAGGEPQRDAVAGCPGVGLANRVLSDGASQDIAPGGPCNRVERLPEPRCAGL